jgi:hypothetical protein
MTGGSWRLETTMALVSEHTFAFAPVANTVSVAPDALQSLPYGTGSGTTSIVFARTYTMAPGEVLTFDLYDGSMTDVHGVAAPFRVLRSWAIWVESDGSASGVTIGNAASNAHPLGFGATTHTKTVFPDGPAETGGSPAGIAVTATVRNVKVLNNAIVPTKVVVHFGGSSTASGEAMGTVGGVYP